MNILKKINAILDDARIAYTFPAFEGKAREQHLACAARRFSTFELQVDANKRMDGPQAIAGQRFVTPINNLKARADRIQTELQTSTAKLAIFERDYTQELNALFANKSQLIDDCRSLNAAKAEAYDDLESAVDDLDRWHSRSSGTFIGNGGKALPKRSIFGQSLGDRDSLKDDRDEAGSEIAACKRALASKRLQVKQVEDRIGQVKAARQQMFDLRAHGYSRGLLKQAIYDSKGQQNEAQRDIAKLQSDLDEFLNAAKHRTGTMAIEKEIDKVCAQRDAFIRSFDTAEAKTRRKALHRIEWLKKNGEKKQ